MDPDGINSRSSLRCRPHPTLTDAEAEELRGHLAAFIGKTSPLHKSAPTSGYIFVPLQLEHDTQIELFSPHFKRMPDFVAYVARCFADRRIVVKPHPLESTQYELKHPNVEVVRDIPAGTLIRGAEAVVGINSTVLIEAVAQEKPVAAVGLGIFTGAGVVHECHQNPRAISAVLESQPDPTRRAAFLYDLLFRYQIRTAELGPEGRIERFQVDDVSVSRWLGHHLERAQRRVQTSSWWLRRRLDASIVASGMQAAFGWVPTTVFRHRRLSRR